MNRRTLLSVALLSGLFPALSGCGGHTAGTSASGGGAVGSAADSGILRVAQTAEPTTLDPAAVQDGPTIELMMQIYNGLVQWNTENKLVPDLAEKWEVSKDGKIYTFHLRQGVKFHNGRPVTAQDFVYSITRSLDPKMASPVAMVYLDDLVGAKAFHDGTASTLQGVEAPDPQTLRLTIDAPKAYFLAKLTYPTAYAVCKEAIEKSGGKVDETSMVGTGPFKLSEYRQGDRLLLTANPDYWEGAPKLGQIERRILLDNDTRHDKFEAGELDICGITMAQYRADKANPKLSPLIKQFPRPSIYYVFLNQKALPQFKDKRVRQAFAMAINKAEIIRAVHEGVPQQAEGIIPPGVPGYNEQFKGLPYDPEKAKSLLAAAGFPGGKGFPKITLSFRASEQDIKNTAVAIANDLQKNLGLQVRTDEVEWTTFLKRRNEGGLQMGFLRWAADYLDPQDFISVMLRTGSPENTLGYSNPEYDRLCDQADTMQDAEQRLATYRKAEALAVDDAPWIPMYFQKDVELWNPALMGVEDSAMGHLPHKRTYKVAGAASP